jgi:hypothetical protein
MIGEVKPIQLDSGEWVLIKGVALWDYSQFLALELIIVTQKGTVSEIIRDKILEMVLVFSEKENSELTGADIKQILDQVKLLNSLMELPSLSAESYPIPETGNYLIDTFSVLISSFSPEDAILLSKEESLRTIAALLYRNNALSRCDEWKAKAEEKEALQRIKKQAMRLDTPEGIAFLKQQLGE